MQAVAAAATASGRLRILLLQQRLAAGRMQIQCNEVGGRLSWDLNGNARGFVVHVAVLNAARCSHCHEDGQRARQNASHQYLGNHGIRFVENTHLCVLLAEKD